MLLTNRSITTKEVLQLLGLIKQNFIYLPLSLILFISLPSVAQEVSDSSISTAPVRQYTLTDSILLNISDNIATGVNQIYPIDPLSGRYKIYQTENIYNLLKLDTATGRLWQVQWSMKDEEEYTWSINSDYLSRSGKIGRFELYPTKNIYQFILLDTTNGNTWHVQCGTDFTHRWIHQIY